MIAKRLDFWSDTGVRLHDGMDSSLVPGSVGGDRPVGEPLREIHPERWRPLLAECLPECLHDLDGQTGIRDRPGKVVALSPCVAPA